MPASEARPSPGGEGALGSPSPTLEKGSRSLGDTLLRDPYFGYLLSLPLLLWILFTLFYPLEEAVRASFYEMSLMRREAGEFIALGQYRGVLGDAAFWKAAGRSMVWASVNLVLQISAAFAAALILNQRFKGRAVIRNWIVLPWVLPTIVLAIIWRWILDPTLGIVNYFLVDILQRPHPVLFLADRNLALWTASFINSWRWFPYIAIIFLAALQTVPGELYEAAAIDGASSFQQLRYVTIPAIMPVAKVTILITFLWAVNIFDTLWLLTEGGPLDATTTLPILIFKQAFQEFNVGKAAATSVLMFLALAAVSGVYLARIFTEE